MERAEIYRRAAELCVVNERKTSCGAIWDIEDPLDILPYFKCPIQNAYDDMFSPEKAGTAFWGKCFGDNVQECRVLALCFAAAMADCGDI